MKSPIGTMEKKPTVNFEVSELRKCFKIVQRKFCTRLQGCIYKRRVFFIFFFEGIEKHFITITSEMNQIQDDPPIETNNTIHIIM